MVFSSLDRANGYKIEEITLYPYDSDIDKKTGGIEISALVTKFSITESIYYLGLTLSMTIVDGINIIEKFNLSGNEKLKIKISKFDKHTQLNSEIDLVFIITEYPLFGKSKNKRYQAFTIEGLTPHTFLDKLISISQYMTGSPVAIIKNIMINYLKYDETKINATQNVDTLYDYIIPNIMPMQAIRTILKTSTDSNSSPLVAWETLKGFNIKGFVELLTQDPYKERIYEVSSFSDGSGKIDENKYLQEITSVLDFSSNLKMSKLEQATNGAFGSTTRIYDFNSKEYIETIFDYSLSNEDIGRISPHTSFTDKFLMDSKSLSQYNEAKEFLVTINNAVTMNTPINGKSHINDRLKHSYLAQAEHMTHLLKLNGDLELSSGSIINLYVPSGNFSETVIDDYFTGKYLVSTVTHNFDDSYTMELKIQRDGLEVELS